MIKRIFAGFVAGAAATGPMTAFMFGSQQLGLMYKPPPKQITERAERKAGEAPGRRPPSLLDTSWLAAHFGFGAAAGAAFGLLRRLYPGSSWEAGILHGLAVWAVGYVGVMPSLGLYPPPQKDRTSRAMVMVAAHVVYGCTLGAVYGLLED